MEEICAKNAITNFWKGWSRMTELKPCPFCGEKAKICATTTKTYPKNHGQHWCYCEKCGATGQSFSDFEDDGSSVFKAIEAWNRRDDNG
jgi:Lar family restriction alleviation protein